MGALSLPVPSAERGFRHFARFIRRELKPKGKILTPFNVVTGAIVATC